MYFHSMFFFILLLTIPNPGFPRPHRRLLNLPAPWSQATHLIFDQISSKNVSVSEMNKTEMKTSAALKSISN